MDRASSGGGGVAILVKNNIQATPIKANASPCELVGIKISTDDTSQALNICWVYSSPNDSDLSGLPNLFVCNTPAIVAGDLNAKNVAWGCAHTTKNGGSLLKIIQKYQLSVEAPPNRLISRYPGYLLNQKRPHQQRPQSTISTVL